MNKTEANVLLCVTGSVAAIKALELAKVIKALGCVNIRIVLTEMAKHYFAPMDQLQSEFAVYTDADEWSRWRGRGDPVLHVELVHWADILVVAPADCLTISKLSTGHCDSLLTCIVMAWRNNKPKLICPSMNTCMWEHPITQENLGRLRNKCRWFTLGPISKRLMCGDVGIGAMAEPLDIADKVQKILRGERESSGKKTVMAGLAIMSAAAAVAFVAMRKK